MGKSCCREIEELKKFILYLGSEVEQSLRLSIKALEARNVELAQETVARDKKIDRYEIKVEEECLQILALYQPVAIDLRMIIGILKINNDLERIGDLSSNIARKAMYLSTLPRLNVTDNLIRMSEKVVYMLRSSLDSFVNMDSEAALIVCSNDEEVDEINKNVYRLVESEINKNVDLFNPLVCVINTARHLERIADISTYIAEEVIYIVKGKIIRHNHSLGNTL